MKIWHVGSSSSPQSVDGINTMVWLVAKEQAFLGHQVTLIVDEPLSPEGQNLAKEVGFQITHISANTWTYETQVLTPLLREKTPDIVHMHSVFLPKQSVMARLLIKYRIPYIITPNGGLDSQRGKLKKFIYRLLIERQRFKSAAAITVVTPGEEETIRQFVPNYQGIIRFITNPFDNSQLLEQQWKGNINSKRIVFLGRLDVLHKGIDILLEIARLVPSLEFHLYGNEDPKTRKWLQRIRASCPPNVHFHSPVFGINKVKVLTEASLYIQTSRWEGFPLSIIEAMYIGLPCVISSLPNFSTLFNQYNLGGILDNDPYKASLQLTRLLDDPEKLWQWSKRAQSFAQDHFNPRKVALEYLKLYEHIFPPLH